MSEEDGETPKIRTKGRPSLDQAAAIDRAIKEAALRELLDKGEAATLNAVAQSAGLTRKTVYARYSSKTELFMAAVREVLSNVEPLQFDQTGTLKDRIGNYIRAVFALLENPHAKAFQQALALEPGPTADLRSDLIYATRTIFFEPLAKLLEDARTNGELAADKDVREVARLVMMVAMIAGRLPDDIEETRWSLRRASSEYALFLSGIVVEGIGER